MKDCLAEPMSGDGCRAEPLTETHREALRAACSEDPDIWAIYYASYAPEHFDESFDALLKRPWLPFAIYDGERVAGFSCFLNLEEDRQTVEIGSTYFRPAMRGTGFNRRVKDMMLRRAFDCGARRVEFRVNERNARSQAAVAKLGAVREGVIRADRISWTGEVRNTVLFSILREEWP